MSQVEISSEWGHGTRIYIDGYVTEKQKKGEAILWRWENDPKAVRGRWGRWKISSKDINVWFVKRRVASRKRCGAPWCPRYCPAKALDSKNTKWFCWTPQTARWAFLNEHIFYIKKKIFQLYLLLFSSSSQICDYYIFCFVVVQLTLSKAYLSESLFIFQSVHRNSCSFILTEILQNNLR